MPLVLGPDQGGSGLGKTGFWTGLDRISGFSSRNRSYSSRAPASADRIGIENPLFSGDNFEFLSYMRTPIDYQQMRSIHPVAKEAKFHMSRSAGIERIVCVPDDFDASQKIIAADSGQIVPFAPADRAMEIQTPHRRADRIQIPIDRFYGMVTAICGRAACIDQAVVGPVRFFLQPRAVYEVDDARCATRQPQADLDPDLARLRFAQFCRQRRIRSIFAVRLNYGVPAAPEFYN